MRDPWSNSESSASWMHDAARRAASGTVIDETDPPEIDDQDIDTLEQTLTDSLESMPGDPVAELQVPQVKKT